MTKIEMIRKSYQIFINEMIDGVKEALLKQDVDHAMDLLNAGSSVITDAAWFLITAKILTKEEGSILRKKWEAINDAVIDANFKKQEES